MVVTCLFEFDSNPLGVYFAGQTINGNVTLEANKIKTTEGVTLKVVGFGYTSWSKSSGTGKNRSLKTHRGHEKFFATKTNLLVPPPGESKIDIIPGIHTFTFSCLIPPLCPSSFETLTYGHIRYLVVITIRRSWKFDQSYSKGFTVIKNLDINLKDPLFKTPFTNEQQKFFGCGPCKSDPLTMQMSLESTGFVPGQTIPVSVLIDNQTKIDVKEVIVELWLTVLYRSDTSVDTQTESLVISKVLGDPVLCYTKKLLNFHVPVPPTPPSDNTHSKLIHISYHVRLNASVKGAHLKKFIDAPVTIGSILSTPQGFIVEQPQGSGNHERKLMEAVISKDSEETDTKDKIENDSKPAPASHWSPSLPVTYEEALYMPAAIFVPSNNFDEKNFKPKYPVYNITLPPSQWSSADVSTWL